VWACPDLRFVCSIEIEHSSTSISRRRSIPFTPSGGGKPKN
jgi:hypothetical protein